MREIKKDEKMSIIIHAAGTFEGPELNISNANFSILAQLLQLDTDENGCGSVEAIELIKKIAFARSEMQHSSSEWERTPSAYRGAKGAHIIEMGLNEQQLLRYLERLEPIIIYAKQNNVRIEYC